MFHATSCGALCITDYVPGLEKCFEIGKEVIVYEDDPVDEIKYYLENEEEMKEIAKAGYMRTLKDHHLSQRMAAILEKAKNGNYWSWHDWKPS